MRLTPRSRRRRLVVFSLVSLGSAACGGGGDGPNGPTTPVPDHIALSQTALTLGQKQSAQLVPVVVDRSGTAVPGSTLAYASGNTSLVSVSGTGLVTSAGPTGSTVVTVTSGTLHVDVPVTVVTRAGAVEVSPAPATLPQRETLQLTATVKDVLGAPIAGATPTFSSGDQSVVTVSPTGLVTSVGPSGSTTIHVASGAASADVTVTVTQVPTSISARTTYVLAQNTSQRITATVLDAVGAPIANPTLTFTSANASLVTVGDDGTVQAGTATGATDVTVHAGAASLAVHVTVLTSAHPTGVLDGMASLAEAWAADVSRAGTVYATGSWTGVPLARADLPSHTLAPVLPTDGVGISDVAFDRAGTTAYLAAGRSMNALIALNVADGTVRWSTTLSGGGISIALAPDEGTVYILTAAGAVHAIDAATHAITATWPVDGGFLNELAIAPDGRRLYVSQYGNQEIVIIDLVTRQISERIHTEGRPRGVAVSLDGAELYVANWDHAEITVFDLATNGRVAQIGLSEQPAGVALTPDGTQIYATLPAFGVDIVDRASRTVLRSINVLSGAAHVAFAPDGSAAVVTLNGSGQVAFIK